MGVNPGTCQSWSGIKKRNNMEETKENIAEDESQDGGHTLFVPPQNRSRRGSTTLGPPKRDLMLEHKIAKWILSLDGGAERSGDKKQPGDFGGWLEDGSVLAGMMTTLCFNSVPLELVADSTGDSKLTPKAEELSSPGSGTSHNSH